MLMKKKYLYFFLILLVLSNIITLFFLLKNNERTKAYNSEIFPLPNQYRQGKGFPIGSVVVTENGSMSKLVSKGPINIKDTILYGTKKFHVSHQQKYYETPEFWVGGPEKKQIYYQLYCYPIWKVIDDKRHEVKIEFYKYRLVINAWTKKG